MRRRASRAGPGEQRAPRTVTERRDHTGGVAPFRAQGASSDYRRPLAALGMEASMSSRCCVLPPRSLSGERVFSAGAMLNLHRIDVPGAWDGPARPRRAPLPPDRCPGRVGRTVVGHARVAPVRDHTGCRRPPARKSLSTLCVRQIRSHSARTLLSPRSANRRNPRRSFICPNTGSTIALRIL